MRICIVYDHVYPATIGGGEKWLAGLAAGLVTRGHEVTYVTMRHWSGDPPVIPGVDVIAVADAGAVRHDDQRRTATAPLRFGAGVGRHLVEHGRRYDAVHVAAFPYFPLLAAAAVRRHRGYGLVADWFEAWTRRYWVEYAGPVTGRIGWAVQRRCARLGCPAVCISHHTAARLREEGSRVPLQVLPGLYDGPTTPSPSGAVNALVVTAARHVPEKRLPLLVAGFGVARTRLPHLRLEIYGDGPGRVAVEEAVVREGLQDAVAILGRRPQAEVEQAMAHASCMASASQREGYGLVVVEAAARGTPSVVVAGPENASTELVTDGVNGAIAATADASAIGAAIVRVVEGGPALRESTSVWFADHAASLRIEGSIDAVAELYERLRSR